MALDKLRTLFACLAVGFLVFYAYARTPAPVPASAPPDQFAAGRALSDVGLLAPAPHPIGSPANQRVRDLLLRRMAQLDLSPTIFRDTGVYHRAFGDRTYIAGGDVEDVIGVLPGRDHSLPALALMAHYDSVAGSPGAADDITGVASVLEIVRAIKAQGTPARDVVVLITDGEEAGLLGAAAFYADNPLAKHIGFVINLEARGGGGRAAMFETGNDNGGAVRLYLKTAKRPSANSLSVFLYKHLPNDTDYSIPKAMGIAGLNYAFIGRQFDYHSPSSTVQALDQGAVQHIGEQVLGTAKALAFSPTLPARTPDLVYGNIVGDLMVAYPAWGGWVLLVVVAGLIALAAWRARRLGPLPIGHVLRGAGAGLLLLAGGAAALHLTRHATGYGFGWMEGRPLLARFPVYEVAIALSGLGTLLLTIAALARGPVRVRAAVLALIVGAASSLFGGFDAVGLGEGGAAAVLALILLGRPINLFAGWIGLLSLGWLAAVAVQVWAPTIALTVAWPLAAGAACAALTAAPQGRRPIGWLAALVVIALTLAWLAHLTHNLLQGLDVPELPALIIWLAAFSLWVLVWPDDAAPPRAAYTPGLVLAIGGVCVSLWLHATSPYSPRYPEAVMPLYVVDQSDGKAWRVSPFPPNAWVRDVLTADGGPIGKQPLATFRDPVWAAPAKPIATAAPQVSISRAPDGRVTVHGQAAGDTTLDVQMTMSVGADQATLNGRPMTLPAKAGKTFLRWEAAPEGFSLAFRPKGSGTLNLAYAAYRPEWPAEAKPLPPLPPNMMDWDMFGSTVVVGTLASRW